MEGTLSGTGSSGSNHNGGQLRGILLHLLQPGEGGSKRHLFPLEEREVSFRLSRDFGLWLIVWHRFQQLELKHVQDRGCFTAMEFR